MQYHVFLIEFFSLFAEEKKSAPLRRSKRLRDTYKSEYASGETSADKDASFSSYDDGKMKNVVHYSTDRPPVCSCYSKSLLCRSWYSGPPSKIKATWIQVRNSNYCK
jgi:hypothetical protein